ncbi:hypothetical protein, partial [Nonomuraea sp. NPDC005692]|uniref:hypothetical protein n=1 Tax=Nonomuraea sp. NPDC005692 TaxID=3157168 RepID=UPI0033DB4A76
PDMSDIFWPLRDNFIVACPFSDLARRRHTSAVCRDQASPPHSPSPHKTVTVDAPLAARPVSSLVDLAPVVDEQRGQELGVSP